MTNNKNAQLAVRYLQCWANRDLASLEFLLAEDCMMADWSGSILGKDNILKNTKKIYDAAKFLSIDIKKIAIGQDCVMAELEIKVNKNLMYVVNVLDYNDDGKIQRIRAYKI